MTPEPETPGPKAPEDGTDAGRTLELGEGEAVAPAAGLGSTPVAPRPSPTSPAADPLGESVATVPTARNNSEQDDAADNAAVLRQMRRRTRRSFLTLGVAGLVGLGAWRWVATRAPEDNEPWPLRRMLALDRGLSSTLLPPRRLAPDQRGRALQDRVNGDLGLDMPVDGSAWRLRVQGLAMGAASAAAANGLTLRDLRQLPRAEETLLFKCIEGWSVVVRWAGVRFRDFLAAYPPRTRSGAPLDLVASPHDLPAYAGMATPDGGYFVGLDMASLLHPQTLLAYEMNGAPLTDDHGAPLRLVTPVKYGVKNIKRIGLIFYADEPPADYWAQQGYDWYLGL